MSGSSIIVAANAVMLKRLRLPHADAHADSEGLPAPTVPARPAAPADAHQPVNGPDHREHEIHPGS
jgi:hypothetical protein